MALTEEEIQKNVLEQFKYDPRISPSEIGVTVKDGVVTLLGTVENYTKKWSAEEIALRRESLDDAFRFGSEDVSGGGAANIHGVAAAAEAFDFVARAAFAEGADFLAIARVTGETMLGVLRDEQIIAGDLDVHLSAAAADA